MNPRVIYVVAYDLRGGIGYGGKLPWHLPADLQHFKALTIGKPVVMGRKTFESIGKPLKLRRNIVMTRDPSFQADGVETASSVDDVFRLTAYSGEIAVIGGSHVFEAFLPFVDTIYATEVQANVEADVFFKKPDCETVGSEIAAYEPDESNAYAMKFVRYQCLRAVTGGSLNESKPS